MITSYEVLLPRDFPPALVSFQFYFQNYGTGMITLYHAAGMQLVYMQVHICYVYPENIFFQLLKLQNVERPHLKEYDLLLMKSWFGVGKMEVDIDVVNTGLLMILRPDVLNIVHRLRVLWLPKPGEELAIPDQKEPSVYHHFFCREVLQVETESERPVIRLEYIESCKLLKIVNAWMDNDENKLGSL